MVLPSPAASDPDHPLQRLLVTVLAGGRASRLHRALVDEGQLCVAGLGGSPREPAAERHGGRHARWCRASSRRASRRSCCGELERLRREPPSDEELERARQIVVADWVFGHERVHQQALAAGFALTLFDLEHAERELRAVIEAGRDDTAACAERALDLEQSTLTAWSLPGE